MSPSRLHERLVVALLVLLAVYHASLLGQGALAFPDEHLWLTSSKAAAALCSGEVQQAAAHLSGWGTRPAEYLIRLPSAFVLLAIEISGWMNPTSPPALRAVTGQNVVVAFLLGFVFYRVTRRLLPAESAAVAAAAFSLLTANHMWVRHVVPYDMALLAHLVALNLALKLPAVDPPPGFWRTAGVGALTVGGLLLAYPIAFYQARWLALPAALLLWTGITGVAIAFSRLGEGAFRGAFGAGLVSGVALALYPAYYAFVPALGAFVVLSADSKRVFAISHSSARNAVLFGTGALFVVSAFEVVARIGDVSYLGSARLLASTITDGSFEEGFVFLSKWLWALDPWAAAWLLPCAAIGAFTLFEAGRRKVCLYPGTNSLTRICVILSGFYLLYGFQSVIMHKMVFTGRYARMYLPVVVWLAAVAISRISEIRWRTLATTIALGMSGFAFSQFASEYSRVGYPADVLHELRISYEDVRPENVVHEASIIPNYTLPVRTMTAGRLPFISRPGDDRFVIVNFAIFSLVGPPMRRFQPAEDMVLIADHPHFLGLRASLFEAYPERKRAELRALAPKLRVFHRPGLEP